MVEFKTIEWREDRIRLLDQRRLPRDLVYLDCKDASSVGRAICTMAIRGAPAIGVAAAMGIALAAKKIKTRQAEAFRRSVEKVCEQMGKTRPTAVNLFWAIERMRKILDRVEASGVEKTRKKLEEEALRIYKEDIDVNRMIGRHGKALIRQGDGVLTHCNAGALATAGYGTALGVIHAAWEEGKWFRVFADETRPLLQGARLTSWELAQRKIPVTVVTDSMAATLMKRGEVNLVIVGADRIARNGDTANKIGTYGLAVVSKWHHIPFYVAAPTSTIDLGITSGLEIPIEERDGAEVTHFQGKPVTPEGVKVFNPAFDVTPQFFIKAIITEKGILRKPFLKELKRVKAG
jgi:methylthioribose-1-phosphate isomerase